MSNKDFITKSFKYFDQQNNKYERYLKYKIKDSYLIDDNNNKILSLIDCESIGLFHNESNVFIWSWVLPRFNITKVAKSILNYGLNLSEFETSDHYFIKPLLVNSRIYINHDYNLDLLLCIVSNISRDKFDFILPCVISVLDSNGKNKIIYTIYYLVKVSELI